jgi:hypothetical protein
MRFCKQQGGRFLHMADFLEDVATFRVTIFAKTLLIIFHVIICPLIIPPMSTKHEFNSGRFHRFLTYFSSFILIARPFLKLRSVCCRRRALSSWPDGLSLTTWKTDPRGKHLLLLPLLPLRMKGQRRQHGILASPDCYPDKRNQRSNLNPPADLKDTSSNSNISTSNSQRR